MRGCSRWLSELASDTTGGGMSKCRIPEGCQPQGCNLGAAIPAGIGLPANQLRWCRSQARSTTGYNMRSLRLPPLVPGRRLPAWSTFRPLTCNLHPCLRSFMQAAWQKPRAKPTSALLFPGQSQLSEPWHTPCKSSSRPLVAHNPSNPATHEIHLLFQRPLRPRPPA